MRNDVTDISCTDASPQKRLARPPGADKGRVGACAVQADFSSITRELGFLVIVLLNPIP